MKSLGLDDLYDTLVKYITYINTTKASPTSSPTTNNTPTDPDTTTPSLSPYPTSLLSLLRFLRGLVFAQLGRLRIETEEYTLARQLLTSSLEDLKGLGIILAPIAVIHVL